MIIEKLLFLRHSFGLKFGPKPSGASEKAWIV